jgi:hypothetical protein
MWEVWIELHLCPEVMYGFHCADFQETHEHSIKCLDISCTKLYPNWTRNVENMETISFMPISKHGLHCTNFHKLENAHQHYTETSYTKFHPNWSTNIESMGRNQFTP